jgi:hypothetical protein
MTSSLIIWMAGLAVGVGAMVLAAGAKMPGAHMAMAATIGILIAMLAVRENRALLAASASKTTLAESTARYMGLVWTWGALGLLVTYVAVLRWHEWWHFFLAFAAVAVVCLALAATLARDGKAGRQDEAMLKVARALTMVQLAGMVVTMLGLIIDGKMTRFLDPRHGDWAANNFFFFGAMALAAISLNALLASRSRAA